MEARSLNWRLLVAGDSGVLKDLLNRAFRLSPPADYLEDFPVWNPAIVPAPNRFQIGGFAGERLVASASLRTVDYFFSDGECAKLGLIGAVATDPDFVGKGFGSAALEHVMEEGTKRRVQSFVLWGSESSLYRDRGFQFGGRQLRVGISDLGITKNDSDAFELRSGWDVAIAEFFLRRKTGVRYSDADILWLKRHRNTEWRTLWVDEKCVAYAAWNRGIDLPGIIHEVDAIDTHHAKIMLRLIQARYPTLEWITSPAQLSAWDLNPSTEGTSEFLAQFRNMDSARLATVWFSGMDAC